MKNTISELKWLHLSFPSLLYSTKTLLPIIMAMEQSFLFPTLFLKNKQKHKHLTFHEKRPSA